MVKEVCFRCSRPVYPLDKVGPLKAGAFFHHGCFKCYICGSRLSLKSYQNNRQRQDDREVYCANHAPQAEAHEPPPAPVVVQRSNLGSPAGLLDSHVTANANGENGQCNNNGDQPKNVVVGDMRMQHALKATEIQKPYPKIVHQGAKYVVVSLMIYI